MGKKDLHVALYMYMLEGILTGHNGIHVLVDYIHMYTHYESCPVIHVHVASSPAFSTLYCRTQSMLCHCSFLRFYVFTPRLCLWVLEGYVSPAGVDVPLHQPPLFLLLPHGI